MARIVILAALIVAPALLSAQTPPTAAPNDNAAAIAKVKVAAAMEKRATRVRGHAVGLDNRPVTPAMPAGRADRATPATPNPGGPAARAMPATPATPATPASPAQRPDNPGAGRRP